MLYRDAGQQSIAKFLYNVGLPDAHFNDWRNICYAAF